MTPADKERVAEWERLAADPSSTEDDHATLINRAVPEMARMLREADALDDERAALMDADIAEIAELVSERDKWMAVAKAWEERAQAALRVAEVAAAELKRLKDAPLTTDQREKLKAIIESGPARVMMTDEQREACRASVVVERDANGGLRAVCVRSADEPNWRPDVARNLARWKMPSGAQASYDPSKCEHSMQDAYFVDTPTGRVFGCSDCDVARNPKDGGS